jgi:hypothetical protein
MAVTLNASTSTGLVQSADTSGIIELQSNGTTALTVNTNEGIQILNCLGVGNATPSTSGAGITFPATQSASTDANTLDDYEEGTWTPAVQSTGGNPTVVYAANGQRGYYTKIGRVVYFQAFLNISTISGGAGDLICGGLPFTAAGDTTVLRTWGNIVIGTNGVNWGTSKTALAGYAMGGATSLFVLALQNDAAWAGIPIGNVSAGDEMVWSGWYQV